MTVAIVTDSNSQLPPALAGRYGITVVPLTVVVDGVPGLEGVDLRAEEFADLLNRGAEVSTAAPSPGEFLAAYEEAASGGADRVVSIHVGSNTSATFGAARLAAGMSPIPVDLVDTGTASFAVACCVWAAARCLEAGGSADEVAAAARDVARRIGNVFIVGTMRLAASGGRLADGVAAGSSAAVPILAMEDGSMRPISQVDDVEGAVAAMADYVAARSGGAPLFVGVGDLRAEALADSLEARIRSTCAVDELVRYVVGPSVAAHTGVGTVGAVFFTR